MYKSFAFAILLSTFFLGQTNPAQAFFNRRNCCCEEVIQEPNKLVMERNNEQIQTTRKVVENERTYKQEIAVEKEELVIPQDRGFIKDSINEETPNTNYYRGLW